MEPQISDYYNEETQMMKIIDKMNEELEAVQKENDILKDDLCMNKEYGRPKVEYGEEELKKIKEELYEQLKKEIIKGKGAVAEGTIKNVLYKLVPPLSEAKARYNVGTVFECAREWPTNWVHWKGCQIFKYVNYSFDSLKRLNVEPEKIYENLYDIITKEIDDILYSGNIVQYRCRLCNQLTNYICKRPFGNDTCGDCDFYNLMKD